MAKNRIRTRNIRCFMSRKEVNLVKPECIQGITRVITLSCRHNLIEDHKFKSRNSLGKRTFISRFLDPCQKAQIIIECWNSKNKHIRSLDLLYRLLIDWSLNSIQQMIGNHPVLSWVRSTLIQEKQEPSDKKLTYILI